MSHQHCSLNCKHLSIYIHSLISNDNSLQLAINWLQLAMITVVQGWSRYSWWIGNRSFALWRSINVRVTDHLLHLLFGMICWYNFFILATSSGDELTSRPRRRDDQGDELTSHLQRPPPPSGNPHRIIDGGSNYRWGGGGGGWLGSCVGDTSACGITWHVL